VRLINHEGIVASVKFARPRCISIRFESIPRLECKTPMKFVVLRFKMSPIPQNYQGLILQYLNMKGLVFEVLLVVKSLWVEVLQCMWYSSSRLYNCSIVATSMACSNGSFKLY
jgi:hypothetical protein